MKFLERELKKIKRLSDKKEMVKACWVLYTKLDGFFNPKVKQALRRFSVEHDLNLNF